MKIILGTTEDTQNNNAGTYIAIRYGKDTEKALEDIQNRYSVPNPNKDFHTTLIYSRVGTMPSDEAMESISLQPINVNIHSEIWTDRDGDYNLVLVFESEEFENLHLELMAKYGYEYDFDKYIPHITLSYNVGDNTFDIDENILLVVDEVKAEVLNEDYKDETSSINMKQAPIKKKTNKKVEETKNDKIEKDRKYPSRK